MCRTSSSTCQISHRLVTGSAQLHWKYVLVLRDSLPIFPGVTEKIISVVTIQNCSKLQWQNCFQFHVHRFSFFLFLFFLSPTPYGATGIFCSPHSTGRCLRPVVLYDEVLKQKYWFVIRETVFCCVIICAHNKCVDWFRSSSGNSRRNEVLVSVPYLTTAGDAVSLVECVACSTNFFFILVINQLDAQNLFYNKFISCRYMFRAPCAHCQEVKIALYSLWYHHTYRWLSGAQVERGLLLSQSALNLHTGPPPIGVMTPEAV